LLKKIVPALLAIPLLTAGAWLGNNAADAANQAPAFALKSASDGKVMKLSDLKGKVVVVDFWATWCPPCRAEIPDFVALQKQYGPKGLQIVGVSVDKGGTDGVVKFMKENHINYPILMSDSATEAAYGGIRAIPTTFLIDKKGNLVHKFIGATEKADFEKQIKAVL
jgi:cytochrome c biogenesis protein CcmG/thiol:disulfide interchange protein DsbE